MIRNEENPSLDLEPADGFDQLLGAAVHYRIATGPHAGRKALTLHTVSSTPPPGNPCIAQLSGFSLHAGTRCHAHERDSLERLCRYITRPAISNERLSVNGHGQVVYRLKHTFRDGTTHVVLDPIDFIARLAAPEVPLASRARSVPRPRTHLTRYHGVFAPNFKHRDHIIPAKAHSPKGDPPSPRVQRSWMLRLKRVFRIDIEQCPNCAGRVRIIACIETPELIKTILSHLAAREDDCYYVDETAHIRRLVDEGKHYFLSRPRRFGKSLLLDTCKELFEGNEAVFRGLAIHERWDWSVRHPVVRVSFGSGHFQGPDDLRTEVTDRLNAKEENAGITARPGSPRARPDTVTSTRRFPPAAWLHRQGASVCSIDCRGARVR